MNLSVDTAYVRSTTPWMSRHHNILVGCVESHQRQYRFAGVQHESYDVTGLVRRHLVHQGYRPAVTELTVLTDGDDGLRRIVREATRSRVKPLLDWFHVAMRIQHVRQIANGLRTEAPSHVRAKAIIEHEVDRLHWRLWHGRPYAVDTTLARIREPIREFRSNMNASQRLNDGPRKLYPALLELKRYVTTQSHVMTNYSQRHRQGLRVATSVAESTVNSLVNQRMNKRRQMRWTQRGAHQLLQVRAAVISGELDQLCLRATMAHEAKAKLAIAA